MRWRKQGRIYEPAGAAWWTKNGYAFNPTVEPVSDDRLRVYYAALDSDNYGRIGYVELDAREPGRVLYETEEPVLDLGPLGAFDDSGVNPSCLIQIGDRKCLYYIGWQRCARVPYMLFSGLATSLDGKVFERHASVPVLDRTATEPYSRSAPCVRAESGRFRAWYWSCERWSVEDGWVHYNNVIRHAESSDGVHWQSTEQICVRPEGPEDYTIGRPWVIKDGDVYKMWYSIRSRAKIGYRIGFADSPDGLTWTRKDEEVGIAPSPEGWDSEMICHPCVVDTNGRRYLFYNGNRHGLTGFGYAELEQD
jgi:predicted GH43/DUF377 family glycosyl hydrolase